MEGGEGGLDPPPSPFGLGGVRDPWEPQKNFRCFALEKVKHLVYVLKNRSNSSKRVRENVIFGPS